MTNRPFLVAVLLAATTPLSAAELKLTAPLDRQVVQRTRLKKGTVRVAGKLSGTPAKEATIEARIGGKDAAWQPLPVKFAGDSFEADFEAPAGGWHRLEVRASVGGTMVANDAVEHVGVGEVFVVAGQSNSANHGEARQSPKTDRVVAFNGKTWQIAKDPQPGASGGGGSFLPPFGDDIVERFDVPVGFVACGIGASSVRQWLPKGATFANPVAAPFGVKKLANGEWESDGAAYANFVGRMKRLGPRGFRTVLWHQGESDANQRDPKQTLPGNLYREFLERIIRDSRKEIGWEAPWFVAQVSYHVPGDESSPEIRAAQASLWKDGVALEGPDSDALKGNLREGKGRGVHFSDKGLREHGAAWAARVGPWVERQEAK